MQEIIFTLSYVILLISLTSGCSYNARANNSISIDGPDVLLAAEGSNYKLKEIKNLKYDMCNWICYPNFCELTDMGNEVYLKAFDINEETNITLYCFIISENENPITVKKILSIKPRNDFPYIAYSLLFPGNIGNINLFDDVIFLAGGTCDFYRVPIRIPYILSDSYLSSGGYYSHSYDIAVNNQYICTAEGDNGISIYPNDKKIFLPSSVNWKVDIDDYTESIDIFNDYALVAAWNTGLKIVDCSYDKKYFWPNENNRIIKTIKTKTPANEVKHYNGYAYLLCSDILYIIDVDPANSAYIVNSISAPKNMGRDFEVMNGYLFYSSYTEPDNIGKIGVIDISNPYQAHECNEYSFSKENTSVAFQDICVYNEDLYYISHSEEPEKLSEYEFGYELSVFKLEYKQNTGFKIEKKYALLTSCSPFSRGDQVCIKDHYLYLADARSINIIRLH